MLGKVRELKIAEGKFVAVWIFLVTPHQSLVALTWRLRLSLDCWKMRPIFFIFKRGFHLTPALGHEAAAGVICDVRKELTGV